MKHPVRADIFQGDKVIWMIFFFLCAISLIEVYSAASNLSYKTGNYWEPVLRHGGFLLVGAIIVVVTHNVPCRWFKFYPIIAIPVSIILLVVLLFIGRSINGGARWLTFMGVPLQPSEIAKGAVVVGVSLILSAMQTEKGADRHAMKYILWMTIPICMLILPENFSTAGILFIVVLSMMFFGRIPIIQMGKLLGIMAIMAACAISFIILTPPSVVKKVSAFHRVATWKGRIQDYSNGTHSKQISPKDFDVENNAQIAHANIAIASSNVIGKFPGNSVQRDFLSQAFSDFIYAIIIEEMGLVGGAFVVLLYIILLFRASRIANRCERNFPAFLVLGLSLLLVTQAIINMAVAVGLFPVTGQPLPLISRGGTSTLINCMYIGMILSVSRFAKRRQNEQVHAEPAPEQTNPNIVEEEFQEDEGIV